MLLIAANWKMSRDLNLSRTEAWHVVLDRLWSIL